jgi:hypothetical protein
MKLWPFSKAPKIELGTIAPAIPLLSRKVVLPASYISAHKHVIGVSKMGKSKLLEAMFLQMMDQRIGVSFIDPHGDSALNILAMLIKRGFYDDKENYKRLLYIEFLDDDYFLPFNVLKLQPGDDGLPRLTVSTLEDNVLQAFHRCWPSLDHGNAPRFDDILGNSCQVLIANQLPLTCVTNLLTDKNYRNRLLQNVDNPDVVSFFTDRFDRWQGNDAVMMIESTLTRISLLTKSTMLKYSLGQVDNVLDFRHIMDSGTCVLFNLGGILDKTAQKFLGCLLTLGYESAAYSRTNILPDQRRNHQFMFDEFHKFADHSEGTFSAALSELRKFEFYETMSHQTYSQASSGLRGALQNAEVRLVFRLGHDDANYLASLVGDVDPTKIKKEEVHTTFTGLPEHQPMRGFLELTAQEKSWSKALENLPKRHAYLKILGKPGAVQFQNITLPSTKDVDQRLIDKVRREYRLRLMKPKGETTLPHHNPQPHEPVQAIPPQAYLRSYQMHQAEAYDIATSGSN